MKRLHKSGDPLSITIKDIKLVKMIERFAADSDRTLHGAVEHLCRLGLGEYPK